jgi:hypothetical protein
VGTGNVDSSQADNSIILVRLDGDADVLSRICRVRLSSVVLIFCGLEGGGFVWAVWKAATTVMSLAMAALAAGSWRELNGVVVCALLFSTSLIAHGRTAELGHCLVLLCCKFGSFRLFGKCS